MNRLSEGRRLKGFFSRLSKAIRIKRKQIGIFEPFLRRIVVIWPEFKMRGVNHTTVNQADSFGY
ncbi:MAG: hypothetical protein WAT93_14350 [Pontixanthobacter sp.]